MIPYYNESHSSIFLKFEDIFQEEFNSIWLDEVKNANNMDNIELFTVMIHFFQKIYIQNNKLRLS